MVNKCHYYISPKDYAYFLKSYVKLEQLDDEQRRIRYCGVRVRLGDAVHFRKSKHSDEVIIDGSVLRIYLDPNSLNLRLNCNLSASAREHNPIINKKLNKSILKRENGLNTTQIKTVSFDSTFYITTISPDRYEKSFSPVKDYDFIYKEYLKSVQMNGACSTPLKDETMDSPTDNNFDDELGMDEGEDIEYLEPPKRKRGRPKGSGKYKSDIPVRPKPRDPDTPPRKRGWPLGLSRKTMTMKIPGAVTHVPVKPVVVDSTPKRRGRPRKIIAFGFQSIVSDIKTVTLPSDLWSAHVSVTAKKSQVCFTRVVQALSNAVPVECDRSVKFNGSVNYLVRINNREVELLAAPPTVSCLRDVEILLEIVNEIGINDPVLEYLNR